MTSKFKTVAIKGLRSLALIVSLVYVGLGVLLWFAQGYLIFPASRELDGNPSDQGLAYEEVRLPVMGYETVGWYVPLEGARGVALFSHGNGGNLSSNVRAAEILRSFGFSVLVYDYGGYGPSTGTPSETRCYADIRAMWDYLVKTRGVPEKKILLYGHSLGGGPTSELAKDVTPGAVILESTFLSIPDVAWENPLYRPWIWLIRHQFRSKDKVARFTAPLMILHSRTDEVIPFKEGEGLFAQAREPKRFVEIQGGHNSGYDASGKVYIDAWDGFLDPIFGAMVKPGAPGSAPG